MSKQFRFAECLSEFSPSLVYARHCSSFVVSQLNTWWSEDSVSSALLFECLRVVCARTYLFLCALLSTQCVCVLAGGCVRASVRVLCDPACVRVRTSVRVCVCVCERVSVCVSQPQSVRGRRLFSSEGGHARLVQIGLRRALAPRRGDSSP
eukprot:6178664-Pleurochrysis_carterae.AAC.2